MPTKTDFHIKSVLAESFSTRFIDDPNPPEWLFVNGHIHNVDDFPTVGIVGARKATPYGIGIAELFGYELSKRGIAVVSGLAYGIDAAAHRGAVRAENGAPPIAVVGGGVDVVYPRSNTKLWSEVAERGVVVSEMPCGVAPQAFSFPARNRIIAALSDILVVVESAVRSGTRHTIEAANDRNRLIMTVPGPISSPMSEGANLLLREGCAPVLDVEDIATALRSLRADLPFESLPRRSAISVANGLAGELLQVFESVDVVPRSLDQIVQACSLGFGTTAISLENLADRALVVESKGGWVRL